MNWRLGLDLGTNSIGWAVIELNKNNEPTRLIDLNSRIFSDGRDPKTKEPLAVARRTARGIRKNLYRKKQRRRQLFRQLQADGLFPQKKEEAAVLKTLNPYILRIKALDFKLEPFELGRALFSLGVRRGFKSNRKDLSDLNQSPSSISDDVQENKTSAGKNEKMSQTDKCNHLAQTIIDSGYRTLGEFLWKEQEKNQGIRFVPERTQYYPTRKLYEDEFHAIKEKQQQYYPNIGWDIIKHIIFHQRPLKPQERGKCQFMYDKERAFKAMPCSHEYRILQEVYNLRYYDSINIPHDLLIEQQDVLIKELHNHKELSFDKIRKILKIGGTFNLETENRSKLNGNSTSVIMRDSKRFGLLWDTLSLKEQDKIVEKMITAQEDSEILEILTKYSLTEEQQKSICSVIFQSGTTSLCSKLTEMLVEIMKDKRIQFDLALEELGFKHYEEQVEHFDLLPYYGQVLIGSTMGISKDLNEKNVEKKYGKIGNPTVHVALNQTRVVVNALIKAYGKPSQIVVELSRDLKNSKDARKEIEKAQGEKARQNIITNKKITDSIPSIQYPGRFERMKYRLWEELGKENLSRKCIYCGKTIGMSELYSKNIEVEHILPFSRTLLDSETNLTIAHAHCNAFKGDRSPYEAFGDSPKGYDWIEIMSRVNALGNPVKRSRFTRDAMEKFEKDSTFIARQLNDNKYLSKAARRYLTCLMNKPSDVWVIPGQMTKMLRDRWEIDSILKRKISEKEAVQFGLKDVEIGEYKKNRYDHRHHALDAMVIGLVDRSLVQQIATLNAQRKTERLEIPALLFPRVEVIEKIKNCVISFKPDHGLQGKLSKETLLGCIKEETLLPIADLREEDIPSIKSPVVKEKLNKLIEQGNMTKAKASLKDEYPFIVVFRDKYVTRVPVISLKEKNIEDVVDGGIDGSKGIRNKLRTYVAEHSSEKIEKVMQDFSQKEWSVKNSEGQNKKHTYRIKKVRCYNHDQKPIAFPCVINGKETFRYYGSDSYVCAVIWQIPSKKEGNNPTYEGQFVRYDQIVYNKKTGKQELPGKDESIHPAAKKICTLFKNDYIEFSQDGVWLKARVAGYDTNANKLDIRPIFTVQYIKPWQIATNEAVLEKGWKPQPGHNFVSINVLFGSLSAGHITVSPIGRVFRDKKE